MYRFYVLAPHEHFRSTAVFFSIAEDHARRYAPFVIMSGIYFLPNECIHTPCCASIVGATDLSVATKDRASTRREGFFLLIFATNDGNVDHEFLVLICSAILRIDSVAASSESSPCVATGWQAEAILNSSPGFKALMNRTRGPR